MKRIESILKDIRSVKIQGARDVAEAGVLCMKITAQKSRAKTKKALIAELQRTARKVLATRPTEPELKNALDSILIKTLKYESENPEISRKYAIRTCQDYVNELNAALNEIGDIGSRQIENGDVILTHCHSETVVEILRGAKKQGKGFEVIVTETRPLYQGVITARELLKSGIKVTYCIDSAMGYVMKRVTKVLVGCDAILADGSIVGKIGTFPIALIADKFEVPVLVAGETMKFDPKTIVGHLEPIEKRDLGEVIAPKKIPRARVINPAFDVTPAEYVSTLITERGVSRPELIRGLVQL